MDTVNNEMKESYSPRVLVADDEPEVRLFIGELLRGKGYRVVEFDPASSSITLLHNAYDVALVDIAMPDMDGFSVQQTLHTASGKVPVIFITGQISDDIIDKTVEACAFCTLIKPVTASQLINTVKAALHSNIMYSKKNADTLSKCTVVNCPIRTTCNQPPPIMSFVARFAPLQIPVLLMGESGTGKEVVAQCIHRHSSRAHQKMIALNCAALSPNLIESELFGYVQGAFTGANKSKFGFFEAANDSTLFLDEIGEMPLELQSKLLRVLDTGEVTPVGSTIHHSVNVRIISATNKDLIEMVNAGTFRRDLYYRLHGASIQLLPLRQRQSDIAELVDTFLVDAAMQITPQALQLLQLYDWPGNIRELKMVVEALKAYAPNGVITDNAVRLVLELDTSKETESTKRLSYTEFKKTILYNQERLYFKNLIDEAEGNMSQVARFAQISRNHLYTKLKKLDM